MPEPMDLSSVQMTNELTKLVKTTSKSPCTAAAAGGTCTDCYWLTPAIHMSCCAHLLHRSSPSASFTKHSFQVETNIAGSFTKLGEEPCNYSLVFAHFDGRDTETDQRIRWEADICIGQCVNILWNEHRYIYCGRNFWNVYNCKPPQVNPKLGTFMSGSSMIPVSRFYTSTQSINLTKVQVCSTSVGLQPGIKSKGITPSSVRVIPGRVFTECFGKLVPDSDVGHAVKVDVL